MDKQRNRDVPDEGPGLEGPDYFSLVIEWEADSDRATSAAPSDELEDEITGRQIRHWDAVDEASLESFTASDPPAWMGSAHAAPTQESAEASEANVQATEPRGIAARIGKVMLAIAAAGTMLHWIQRLRRHYALRTA